MENKIKWMDLSDIGVYFGSYRDQAAGKAGLSVIDMDGKHGDRIRQLGFEPVQGEYGKDVYIKADFVVTPATLKDAFGTNALKWVVGPRAAIDAQFKQKLREKTRTNMNVVFAQQRAIGMNDRDEVVFESANGRLVSRQIDGVATIVREDGHDRAAFLRARTQSELQRVARGFVRRIVVRGNKLRRDHVKQLMALSNEGGFSARDYQEAIEFEINVLLQEELAKALAGDAKVGELGAYDIANQIYLGMPELRERTASSVANQQYSTPVALSVLAQALLAPRADIAGKTVLDPTIGNASLVSTFNAHRAEAERCTIYGLEIDPDRVAAARQLADKVMQGDATETGFRGLFGEPDGFDYIIANPPFGSMPIERLMSLPEGSAIERMSVKRLDHYILLESLHARKDEGRAVFITGADSVVGDGEIKGRSKHLIAYLYDHYHVEGVVDVSGELYKKHGAGYPLRLYVVGARREQPLEAELPERLPVLHSYDAVRDWAAGIIQRRDGLVLTQDAPELPTGAPVEPVPAPPAPAAAPALPRVLSPEASAAARRETYRNNGNVVVARYLGGQVKQISPALHRYASEGKVVALRLPSPKDPNQLHATQAVIWWDGRNPRIALRAVDGQFAVVSLQRRGGQFASFDVLAIGEAAQKTYMAAFERLLEAERDAPVAEAGPVAPAAPAEAVPATDSYNDPEEALRTLEVDLPDLEQVAQALAQGVDPANGKPIASEGARRTLVSELERLRDSVASVKEARPGDEAVARRVDEAITTANAALAASQPVAPQGSELRREPEAKPQSAFERWFETFNAEKGIDPEHAFEIEGARGTHFMTLQNVFDGILGTTSGEQRDIKAMLVRIDVANGDVVGYYKHLAKALVAHLEARQDGEAVPVPQPAPNAAQADTAETRGEARQPWELTRAEWDEAIVALAQPAVLGRRPGRVEGERIAARERLRYAVNDWYFQRAKDGDETAREWLLHQAPVAHRDVIVKALAEGQPVPAHVRAEYPDLAPEGEGKTAAVTTASLADPLKAVVALTIPFDGLPPGWIVMNAPRPLVGDQYANGEFLTGRFYVAIDPNGEFAERFIAQNVRDDARVVFVADLPTLTAMALQTVSPRYHAAYLAMDADERDDAMRPFINRLHEGRTYAELVALAAKGMPVAEAELEEAEPDDVAAEPAPVPVSAPAFPGLLAQAEALAASLATPEAFRTAMMDAFGAAVDAERAALYARLGLQRGVARAVLTDALDAYWDAAADRRPVAAEADAGAAPADPNIGRKWTAPEGEVEVVGYLGEARDRYRTLLNGKPLGAPVVPVQEIDAVAAFAARAVADAEARRAAQEEQARQAAVRKASAEFTEGYADQFAPARRGKVIATLNQTRVTDGKPVTLKDLVRRLVMEGRTIETGPDGKRRLVNADGAFFDERDLLKTGMDYATHLIALRDLKVEAQATPAAPVDPEPEISADAAEAAEPADAAVTLAELMASPAAELDGELPEDTREDNEFQQPYVAYSNVSEPTTMIPANLSGPVYEALARVKVQHGDIDEYVARELQFEASDLGRYFKAEQVDALALIFAAHDNNLGFLLADKMGVGKGRVIAAVARRERLNHRIPMFVSVTDNLFTDFLERDIVDIDSRHLFENPLIVNDGSKTTDKEGNVVVRSLKRDEYRRYAEAGELPPGTDIILLTYSQLSRRPATHLTSRYMIGLTERYPVSLLLDESHNGAGASNTGDNLNAMISIATRREGKVLYSSGTPIKGAKNLNLYRKILPEGVNTEELLAAVASDPLSLQEALNYEIAARGCLIARELDSSRVEKVFQMSERREHNLAVSDQVADILSAMAYISGDVQIIVRRLNKEFEKELKAIPESEREGARMGAASLNFGSRLHAITGQLLLALKTPDVLDLALKALEENRKPIIALRRTGGSLLEDYVDEAGAAYEADADRRKKVFNSVTLKSPVTFRDYMHKMLSRLTVITVTGRYGDVSKRIADSEEIGKAVERLERMIDELPGDLPLTPIDYIREGLEKRGYSLAEVSGRKLRARTMENGEVMIEQVPGHTDKTRVNRAVRDFNNGEPTADVLLLTASGSTGLSVHASPAVGKDLRPRRMIKAEMQSDITAERQMDGRHDRTGQIEDPEYVVPLTGLPADDRLAMMFNNANRSLTSSTVANRDSKELIKTVPDLLNVVGDEVAYMMLYENPSLARQLDINMPEPGEGWEKPPLWYVKSLTGHMTLLRSAEQFSLYADLQSRFTERLDQLKAEGRNPLEVVCHDWKARVTQRDVYMGSNASAKPGVRSMFNSPVYLTTLEYQHEMKAVRAQEIDQRILRAEGHRHGDGGFDGIRRNLSERRHALLQQVTSKSFASVEAALAAAPDKEGKLNETRKMAEKLDWLDRNLAVLGRGSVFFELDVNGEMQPNVVLWYAGPRKVEEYSRPSNYCVYTMQPGSDQISVRTLSSLHAGGIDFAPQGFAEDLDSRDQFDQAENGIVTRRVRVLDGNLFEATSLNLREHLGRKIVYTDVTGQRQHGIMVHANITEKMLLSIPERVRDVAVLLGAIERTPVGTDPSGEADLSDKYSVVVHQNRQGEYLLRVPGSKTHGGDYFLDPRLSLIKGQEAENRFGLDFSAHNGGMRATVPPHRLPEVLSYLMEYHNLNFYIKDRDLLRTVRRGLEREELARQQELAA